MSYDDGSSLPETRARTVGRKIYEAALADRRGFRDDQLGIEDPDIWAGIFRSIGHHAMLQVLETRPDRTPMHHRLSQQAMAAEAVAGVIQHAQDIGCEVVQDSIVCTADQMLVLRKWWDEKWGKR